MIRTTVALRNAILHLVVDEKDMESSASLVRLKKTLFISSEHF